MLYRAVGTVSTLRQAGEEGCLSSAVPRHDPWVFASTSDYTNVAPDLARQNVSRLDALATKLKKFPGYRIRIVGHAVSIYWFDPQMGKLEQQDILIPLSRARAEAVKQALVDRGIEAGVFTTAGVGASDQLVPDSDLVNRWQNRRVALYLER